MKQKMENMNELGQEVVLLTEEQMEKVIGGVGTDITKPPRPDDDDDDGTSRGKPPIIIPDPDNPHHSTQRFINRPYR